MTPPEFKRKWAKYSGKETSAYQGHFNDLCALIGQASPAAADPTGSESFCFQKRVVKDAELFAFVETAHVEERHSKNAASLTFGSAIPSRGNTKAKRKISMKLTGDCCVIGFAA